MPINRHKRPTDPEAHRNTLALAVLVIMLAAFVSPYCAQFVLHHPDERHYTDAAITMVQNGDYITPRTADGSPRFRKPVLTYWLVAASYYAFGINPLASRLPFLLTACGVVVGTYWLGRRIWDNSRIGLIAAAIMACHPILLLSATRSIPDIVLTFFLLISAIGFTGLVTSAAQRAGDFWLAYVGAALAIASKGLPALAFLLCGLTFARFNPWKPIALRRFVHLPSMTIFFVVALGWFIAVFTVHGGAAVSGFWSDQVTNRVASSIWKPFYQFPSFVGLSMAALLPWSGILLWSMWRGAKWQRHVENGRTDSDSFTDTRKQVYRFLGAWIIVYALLAAVVTKFSSRYVLPVSPLLAVGIAQGLYVIDTGAVTVWMRRLIMTTGATVLILVVLAVIINVQLGPTPLTLAAAAAILLLAVAIVLWGLSESVTRASLSLSTLLLLVCPSIYLSARHFALPDQGAQISANLLAIINGENHRQVDIYCKPALAAKVRVCSGGRLYVRHIDHVTESQSGRLPTRNDSIIVYDSSAVDLPDMRAYWTEPASYGIKDIKPLHLATAIWHAELVEYLESRKQCFQLAVKKSQLATAPRSDTLRR